MPVLKQEAGGYPGLPRCSWKKNSATLGTARSRSSLAAVNPSNVGASSTPVASSARMGGNKKTARVRGGCCACAVAQTLLA